MPRYIHLAALALEYGLRPLPEDTETKGTEQPPEGGA